MIFRWIINALALLAATQLIDGFAVDTFYHALVAALLLGLVNAVIRPVFILLTFPITILTLGLFIFVINALMLLLVGSVVKGVTIAGFLPALVAALFLWAVSIITNWFIKTDQKSTK